MSATTHHCPLCGDLLIEVEAALNRTWSNVILTGWGSSQLQIRLSPKRSEQTPDNDPEDKWDHDKQWMPFMDPDRSAAGLYCTKCGALTIAPSIPAHRKELGLDS